MSKHPNLTPHDGEDAEFHRDNAVVERTVRSVGEPMPVPLLAVKNLRVAFDGPRGASVAVSDVSLNIAPGEAVGLVGESGSGKTITGLSVMRLLPSNCSVSGSIEFDGRDIFELSPGALRQVRGEEIALVPQNAMVAFNPMMTIGQQLVEAITVHQSVGRKAALERGLELLELTGITNPRFRAAQYPHEFSGGMLQRALIAMSLSCEPRLLIADEPTTALDVTIQRQIVYLLDSLRRQLGMGLLLVTHDLGLLAGVADRVYVMYAGTVVETGTVEDIFERNSHPYTQGLLASAPKLFGEQGADMEPIRGTPVSAQDAPSGCPFQPRCSYRIDQCSVRPRLEHVRNQQFSACWRKEEVVDQTLGAPSAGAARWSA